MSWEGQARDTVGLFHKGAKKTGTSLRTQVHNATHGETGNPGKRVKAVTILLALTLFTVLIVDQAVKQPTLLVEAFPLASNKQFLFKDDFASSNLINWNTVQASYQTHAGAGLGQGLLLDSNSTNSAIALSKNSFGIDTVSAHQFSLNFPYCFETSPANVNNRWGVYLTRNGTLPLTRYYRPNSDPNVILSLEVLDVGAGNIYNYAGIQTEPTTPITLDNYAGLTEGQRALFSTFASTQFVTTCSSTNIVSVGLLLNFTGNVGSSLARSDHWTFTPPAGVDHLIAELAKLQFQGLNVFMGVWQEWDTGGSFASIFVPGTSAAALWSFGVLRCDPSISVPVNPSQAIDTGGFFGPLIKALIAIGVFILTAIASFLGFIADAFVTAMNAVGGFFGIGAIGSSIRSFLTGIANFVANVFGTVFGWAVTFASLFTNGITFFANFLGGSFGFVGWITSFFTSIAGIFAIIQDLWNAVNTVVLAMNAVLVLFYLVGMFMVYTDGWPGFKQWLEIGTTLVLSIVKGAFWIGKEMTDIIVSVKQLLFGWI